MVNILQIPVHLTYMSLVNRLAFNYDLHPGMLTDGFLWFKDLSVPDPYGILPIIGSLINMINII